eukprot:CAMPEP_0197710494 /NCGR_PEP_ID=MMETSP1338-20131121/128985_1 /TAXON_ID=43686 ORGANISM="Pelagodinium beii, Strain RCC1491" /NCGR_SAMPLE_ID=MMETSP1338 /ASSEMBLY_ACC=CAM_ASM_000754 /LENGTH=51 /DNA_ID=CAMNT_0043294427 /DNA_START=68 /DNA_END=223 /DNA_ORIENTATION=+
MTIPLSKPMPMLASSTLILAARARFLAPLVVSSRPMGCSATPEGTEMPRSA